MPRFVIQSPSLSAKLRQAVFNGCYPLMLRGLSKLRAVLKLRVASTLLTASAAAALAACGGGGGDTAPVSPVGAVSNQYAQQCSANNPYRQDSDAGPNPSVGTLAIEKQWAREYVNEAYFWYSQVPSVDPNAASYSVDTAVGVFPSLDSHFTALTTTPDDRFSFSYPSRAWKQLSEGGITLGYGLEFAAVDSAARIFRIAFVEPGGPAATAGLQRGDTVTAIDGAPIASLTAEQINAALLPTSAVTHTLTFARGAPATTVVASLTAGSVTLSPVPATLFFDTPTGRVGYLLFNDHVLPAENALIGAVQGLRAQGVNDLVLDLRYNGGGFLYIASQVAYMVAGPARTTTKIFERRRYNDKRVAESNSTNSILPFFNVACVPDARQQCTSNADLPSLNLSRVWVLAGPNTCSASEAIVNSLRGIDVAVNIIGNTTCGKPYGFAAKDNCGISYFPIEFQGVNAKGFGDYANGFAPTCTVSDDFDHALGDPAEGMLAAALAHRATGACPAPRTKPSAPSRLLPRPERSMKLDLPTASR